MRKLQFLSNMSWTPLSHLLIHFFQWKEREILGLRAFNRYHAAAAAKSLQSCLTLCDPTDGSPPGSPVPEILQARILERVAISFSNAWNWKVKVKSLSCVRLFATSWTATYQAGSSTHGIFQARVLEWDAITFSEHVYTTIHKIDNRQGSTA